MERILRFIFSEFYGNSFLTGDLEALLAPRIKELAPAVAALSQVYTRNREALTDRLLSSEVLRKAYLSYFLPCNLEKFKTVLEELFAPVGLSSLFPARWRILDLGSGPGTQLLGMLSYLKTSGREGISLDWLAVDSVEENLRWARLLSDLAAKDQWGEAFRLKLNLETRKAVVGSTFSLGDVPPFHLIVAGNLLNEICREESLECGSLRSSAMEPGKQRDQVRLPGERASLPMPSPSPDASQKRYELLSGIARRCLSPEGFLVLLEPALRETSRDLLSLRDLLVTRGGFHIHAPCVHENPCPAVAPGNQKDWCHEDRPWQPPRHIRKIDSLIGNWKNSLKYSYAVLSRLPSPPHSRAGSEPGTGAPAEPVAGGETSRECWRVVSERIEAKGKASVFLCGQPGRIRVTRLNRDRSPTNAAFGHLERGQVVVTCGLHPKQEVDWRVEKECSIQILREVGS